jgi:hypothetical protein
MKTAIKVLGAFLLVGLLISCPLLQRDYSISPPDSEDIEVPDDGFGTLQIIFGAENPTAKTLAPSPVELDIIRYELEGTLEGGGDSFSGSVAAGEALTQTGLTPGTWSISVDAINSVEITIGHGAGTAEIVAGESTTVRIMISPSGGLGTLVLRIEWKKQLFTSEEIVATVTPAIDDSSNLDFGEIVEDANLHYGNYINDAVPAGYYLVTMQLIGDGQKVWGLAEAVIIFEGATTSHTYTYSEK